MSSEATAEEKAAALSKADQIIRGRYADNLEYYSSRCLKIQPVRNKGGSKGV